MTIYIDRTAIITAQRCPRERYYQRSYKGKGIEKIRKSLPLQFGSAFHAGAEKLLHGDVEGAVIEADLSILNAFTAATVDLEEKDRIDIQYAIDEQCAMAEALIRGWFTHDGERFLRDFEVLEVEREGQAILKPETQVMCVSPTSAITKPVSEVSMTGEKDDIILQFRPDALVRERLTSDLYIISWKTASTFGQYTIDQCNVDMQSMSEVWGTEQVIQLAGMAYPKIEGVIYLFACKGKRKLDEVKGFKVQDSSLVYGWLRRGPTEEDNQWFHSYAWKTEEINPKTGKLVGTTLGRGVQKVPIWREYPGGIEAWIDDLARQRIEPRHINALDAIYPQMMPVSRRADEIESWKRQTVAQEMRIQQNLGYVGAVEDMGGINDAAILDETFPQHTHSCLRYGGKCSFFEVCWNPVIKSDPLGSNLYQIRTANHPEKENDDD